MRLIDADMLKTQNLIYKKTGEVECDMPTVDAIPIPKDATNGDMIKAIFPKYHFVESNIDSYGWTIEVMECEKWDIFFDRDWWNAPYVAESSRE